MVAKKTLKLSQNYPYLISPIDETTKKHVFLPQKGPYLPNRPNRKMAWDSVTRRVWVYREKFNIDFWFQIFFLTSQHVLGLPNKTWEPRRISPHFTIVNWLLPKLLQKVHIYTGAGSKVIGFYSTIIQSRQSNLILDFSAQTLGDRNGGNSKTLHHLKL